MFLLLRFIPHRVKIVTSQRCENNPMNFVTKAFVKASFLLSDVPNTEKSKSVTPFRLTSLASI